MESSAEALVKKEKATALDKAKEAGRRGGGKGGRMDSHDRRVVVVIVVV